MAKSRTVDAPAELLAYLFAAWPEVKKKQVRTWLKHRAVIVNGRAVTQFDHRLRSGDVVSVRTDRVIVPEAVAASGLDILFEDAAVLVIEKPAGLLSIATATELENTAYHHLTDYVRQAKGSARARVWIVHRLDRETSGLMVFAKSAEVKRVLQGGWSDVVKRYQAVVEGRLPAEQGTLESHLNESSPSKVFRAPRSERTRHALTRYRVMASGASRTLVELVPETGRRHQLRVHLADAGCPIVGDRKYGAKTDPADRIALHACVLEFSHPETGEALRFDSPLPLELARLCKWGQV